VGQHRGATASRLLGLDGFEVIAAQVVGGEWQLEVQTTATVVGCQGCGVRAELHGRRTVRVRDLPISGRPVVLLWRKRLWRCRESACGVRTWTEQTRAIHPRAVLTQRARAEACRRVGKDAHAVAAVARDLGVGWVTIMRAVHEHGTLLVDDPTRLDGVATLGLDETSFLRATRLAPTRWVTGLVDLEGGRLLDVVADRTRAVVDTWLHARPRGWLAQVGTVALDPGVATRARWWHRLAMPGWWWTTSTPSGSPTRWSTRSAVACSRPPWATGAASAIRCTASASCCSPPKSSSPSGDGRGYGLGWPPVTLVVRWPRPGRAKSCCAPSTERSACQQPAPPWTASTTGQMASRFVSCPGWPAPCGSGRLSSWPSTPPMAAPTDPPRPSTCSSKGQARGARLPQLHQLPAAAAAALRRQVADSPNHKTARPLPTRRGVEPVLR
jgi:zinc-finger of transposase IS204/IS1001/IS1096/IS1165/Helix-turn-helix domain of transposase family ISL3